MLIPSHRHRPEDLLLWAELEAADLINASSWRMQKKIEASKKIVDSFIADDPAYCSVSWGKDSVVVAHIVRQLSATIKLVWVRWPRSDNPDSVLVRDTFADNLSFDVIAPDDDADDGRLGFSLAAKFAETPRRISGLRASESTSRRLSISHEINTLNSCRPLAWWSLADIFGYLAVNSLPVHPVYAMLGGGRWNREQIRVDSIGGARGRGAGRDQWEREYYGDVLNRLASGRASSAAPACEREPPRYPQVG